jgi:hypothetical protein
VFRIQFSIRRAHEPDVGSGCAKRHAISKRLSTIDLGWVYLATTQNQIKINKL